MRIYYFTHMHGLEVNMKDGHHFGRDLSLENSGNFYLFFISFTTFGVLLSIIVFFQHTDLCMNGVIVARLVFDN